MKVEQRIIGRFNQLISGIESLIQRRQVSQGYEIRNDVSDFMGYEPQYIEPSHTVDKQGAIQWQVSCLQLFSQIFGAESNYISEFKNHTRFINSEDNYDNLRNALGVLKGAKDDYENSYLFDTRTLIEAEVFDEFLEQAEELFKKRYYQAAAVIAGCVLEDGLRKLGQRKIPSFPTGKTIDPMNIELAKAGIYNALWQKKITALADTRNKAAHGKWTEFTEKDVEDMIRDVRRFMEDYFS